MVKLTKLLRELFRYRYLKRLQAENLMQEATLNQERAEWCARESAKASQQNAFINSKFFNDLRDYRRKQRMVGVMDKVYYYTDDDLDALNAFANSQGANSLEGLRLMGYDLEYKGV